MTDKLSIRIFAHSWVSDWNHGNAHFLRGLARELIRAGHEVRCYEELGSWSLKNLIASEGERATEAIDDFRAKFPELNVHFYNRDEGLSQLLRSELKGADLVLIHEWNDPYVVNTILSFKEELGFKALFHDTHHRAYTNAGEILRFHLHKFDGVLAFGEAIRNIYVSGFGLRRAWTFHEAADVDDFRPIQLRKRSDVLWIGNWGDEERTRELQEFLIEPAQRMGQVKYMVHGVRYPDSAVRQLSGAGIRYCGYLPNLKSPEAYAQTRIALHVPRRQYANGLSGIPTIRVFEVLACGVPLVCSPWSDVEGLFREGEDYITVADGKQMEGEVKRLLADPLARRQIAQNGLATIRARHTCRHRAEQLLEIYEDLGR